MSQTHTEHRAKATTAVRATGIVALAAEAVIILLAAASLRFVTTLGALGWLVLFGMFAACVAGCFVLREPAGWYGVLVLHGIFVAAGFWLHAVVVILSVCFLGIWIYILRLRHVLSAT